MPALLHVPVKLINSTGSGIDCGARSKFSVSNEIHAALVRLDNTGEAAPAIVTPEIARHCTGGAFHAHCAKINEGSGAILSSTLSKYSVISGSVVPVRLLIFWYQYGFRFPIFASFKVIGYPSMVGSLFTKRTAKVFA